MEASEDKDGDVGGKKEEIGKRQGDGGMSEDGDKGGGSREG